MNRENVLDDLIPSGAGGAAAVLLTHGGRAIFATPLAFLQADPKAVGFHLIGGQRRPTESWADAAIREVAEEIGIDVKLVSARETVLATSDEIEGSVSVTDQPKPFCVYRRTSAGDKGFYHGDVHWVVGYLAEPVARMGDFSRELAFVLLLTHYMLERTRVGNVTFGDIKASHDGSELLVQDGISLDPSRVVRPTGLALATARIRSLGGARDAF